MPMPRMYKTEAIVLRGRRLGEADRILTLFTPTFGKIDAKAKGVRKTTSRMSGHLQPLTRCVLQLAQRHAAGAGGGGGRGPGSAPHGDAPAGPERLPAGAGALRGLRRRAEAGAELLR